MDATNWIKPGAEVVVYRSVGIGDRDPIATRIAKVAKQSFTVEEYPTERFQLATLATKPDKSRGWGSSYYKVTTPNDPKVAELRAEETRSSAVTAAISAVEDWNMGARRRNAERVQAAIDALTALRDTL